MAVLKFFDKIHKNLLSVLFPMQCNGCKKTLLFNENIICTNCLFQLPFTTNEKTIENQIYSRLKGLLPLEFAHAVLFFQKENITQELIHNLKYRAQTNIGELLAKIYFQKLKDNKLYQNIEVIIPVPIHPKKRIERGYNQVDSFGETLSDLLHIPYEPNALKRKVYTKSQTTLNRQQRQKNYDGVFEINNQHNLVGKRVLLIDDVITTGATLEACFKEILKVPDVKIAVLAIAFAID
jgi:ComF family protein